MKVVCELPLTGVCEKTTVAYKYTHNVLEHKTCMIFVLKRYAIYTGQQPQSNLLHHTG